VRIIAIADAVSLPHGMASTQRLTLLARGLHEAGADVEILLTRGTATHSGGEDGASATGVVAGIPFRYVCGSPVVPRTRIGRRMREVQGLGAALRAIWQRHSAGGPLTVMTYSRHLSTVAPVGLFCRRLGISVVAEMCEWPVTQTVGMTFGRWRRRLFCRHVVRFADGFIPISRYIEREVELAARRLGRRLETCYVPILCRAGEAFAEEVLPFMYGPYVLFSASEGYRKTVTFVLDAFREVGRAFPAVRLVVTGIRPASNPWLQRLVDERGLSGKVDLPGFISRPALLTGYRRAAALLIPLFDDAQSRARFPTKIAEYLLAGRPVVTSSVGEVPSYLVDRETAYLAAPDAPGTFAAAVMAALADRATADRVGAAGRDRSSLCFDYRSHGVRLHAWILRLAAPSGGRQGHEREAGG
jgi:glycosyltransferase involved in cell wall biosynthesis